MSSLKKETGSNQQPQHAANPCPENSASQLDAQLMRLMKGQIEAASPFSAPSMNQLVSQALDSLAPRDNVEAMLMTQMVSVHNVIMTLAMGATSEVKHNINDRYPRSNVLAKLVNAYTRQMETLTAYRGRQSNQRITVEQVNVESGGQAVVGNVNSGGAKDVRN